MRKRIASQIVPLVTVAKKACWRPAAVRGTLPIWVMPRLSMRSPALAQVTITRIMRKVFTLRRWSCCIGILYGNLDDWIEEDSRGKREETTFLASIEERFLRCASQRVRRS